MKFKSLQDKQLFLLEIGRIDIYSTIDESWTPTPDLVEMYVKSRSGLISGLKDFRKSQNTKESWRKNRHKYMKGIKNFHRSTKGKRLHRAMSGYLINHESYKDLTHPPVFETLKAINSLKTHLYIELEYYTPVNEYMELVEILENLIPCTNRVEQFLLQGNYDLLEEDKELLIRLTETDELLQALSLKINKPFDDIKNLWENTINEGSEEILDYYSHLIQTISK